jgi:hypothetical protein
MKYKTRGKGHFRKRRGLLEESILALADGKTTRKRRKGPPVK